MSSRSRRSLYGALLLITGCFSSEGEGCTILHPNGLAGNGSFDYDCVGEGSDPECTDPQIDLSLSGRLPSRPIARTATFRLTFLGDSTRVVQAASTNAVSGSGTFTALRAGNIGFFVEARNGTTDIEDAIRLTVADPESVVISKAGSFSFGEQFTVGKVDQFRVQAFAKKSPLAGSLTATWEIEPEGIVELEPGRFGTCTLRALAPGKVTLTVKAAGLSDTLPIEVKDGPTFGESDGGSDASNDADGGSLDASQD